MRIPTGAALVCVAASAGAQSGGFITQLGKDTIAVERFVRTPDSIMGEMITRSPKTARYSYVARLDRHGAVATYTALFYQGVLPGSLVRLRADADLRGPDSIRLAIKRGDSTQHAAIAFQAGAVPILEPAMGQYEIVAQQAIAANGKRIPFAGYYLGDIYPGSAIRAAPNLVLIETRTDTVRARIDRDGRITSITDPGGTLQATVTRVPPPDLDKWGVQFMTRDAAGQSLGALSPRDTVRATVGSRTHVLVDYGRPSKRGRAVVGGLIPYNAVWRTGANAATTMVVDKGIMLGDKKMPAGEYTLFSLATPDSWTLIVSKKTKEWGTDYDSTADFARIPMTVSSGSELEQFTIGIDPKGGNAALRFAWDTRVGRVGLTPMADSE
jgi:hypothetical protein